MERGGVPGLLRVGAPLQVASRAAALGVGGAVVDGDARRTFAAPRVPGDDSLTRDCDARSRGKLAHATGNPVRVAGHSVRVPLCVAGRSMAELPNLSGSHDNLARPHNRDGAVGALSPRGSGVFQ